MEQTEIDYYKKAGKIAAQVLEYGKGLIKKDAKLLDVCDKIEAKIAELGAKPAFPVQISLNQAAAHYCPEADDETVLTDQLCCLDVGVHVDGCIGDNACSVDLSGNNSDLVKASQEALKAATEVLSVGVEIGKIGKAIEDAIVGMGFQPVRNLSGHGLDSYNIHSAPSIPNFDSGDRTQLEKGQVIAIEPFATDGAGMIHEKGEASVFMLVGKKSVRVGFVRDILKQIESYNGLPFTTRWLTKNFSEAQVRFALNQLKQLEILKEYPPLVERSDGLVSQAENSFYIDDEVVVLTKL
ncbi:type II methionyl aminopeptidase [Candidatus Woesearchaeota archaeon]|nr:type II methionyl aminopeptidase [Candidatus Woesearchaeota archaeon]